MHRLFVASGPQMWRVLVYSWYWDFCRGVSISGILVKIPCTEVEYMLGIMNRGVIELEVLRRGTRREERARAHMRFCCTGNEATFPSFTILDALVMAY